MKFEDYILDRVFEARDKAEAKQLMKILESWRSFRTIRPAESEADIYSYVIRYHKNQNNKDIAERLRKMWDSFTHSAKRRGAGTGCIEHRIYR